MAIGVQLSPESIAKLRRMAKEAGPKVQRRVNKGLREAGRVGSEAAKKTVRAANPPKADQRTASAVLLRKEKQFGRNHGHTGLREGIAKGTRVALGGRRGVRIVSSSRYLAENQKGMNRVYRLKTFRHPVFGNKKAWAKQHGLDWFYGPISKTTVEMRAALFLAMKQASDDIAKG
ncbi:hypothetical protein SPF06_01075 [Sinomonas sp. JGH33]|uniref:HK97 gp10 family phage protein n=1 Tax=Sinomonas terricola TaxID=3110330 RepID=A0ABU5T0X2_9MICC|nr:hypothetical protein [Sinomonas sp. JGH33]MEA5453303.1 hypothetical protein [Sinomonas sp. JGH33]